MLNHAGGGCCHGLPNTGRVRANGVTIRVYDNVKSPDYDGSGGDGVVNLADLVAFSGEFTGAIAAGCHDYNNDGGTGLEDLICFAEAFTRGIHCP